MSEPFSDLPGVWHEIPPATAVIVRPGGVLEERPFRPQATDAPVATGTAGVERRGARQSYRLRMRVVSCAHAVPSRAPIATSPGKCTPVWTRE